MILGGLLREHSSGERPPDTQKKFQGAAEPAACRTCLFVVNVKEILALKKAECHTSGYCVLNLKTSFGTDFL